MRRDWSFLPAQASSCAHLAEHVLEQHDGAIGALVASFLEDGQRFVGVAVDREGESVRWIEAPVSDCEWDSLLRGLTSLRDVLSADVVWVVDRTVALKIERSWRVPFSGLTEDHLPDKDSLLDADDHEHLLAPASRMPKLRDVEPPPGDKTFFPRAEDQAA